MIHIEQWLKDSWNLYKDNLLNVLSLYAVYLLAGLIAQKIPFLSLLVMPPLFGSLIIITLQKIRGTEIDLRNMSSGFSFFLPLLLSSVLIGFFVFLGFLVLIIPGIIVSALYIFTIPLIVDQKMDFWEAMETSRKKVMEDAFGFIIFAILLMALVVLGPITMGVGLMGTMPLTVNALAYAYIDVFGVEKTITVG